MVKNTEGGQAGHWLWNVGYAAGGAALALIAQSFFIGVSWGEQVSKLTALEKRVDDLDKAVTKAAMPGKGDLCMKLLDAQVEAYRTSDNEVGESVEKQLKDLGCYNVNATVTGEQAKALGFPVKE